jgi:hypothetical protein
VGAFLGLIIAIVIGAVVGVGASFGLVASQGGGRLPTQVEGPIVVYGTN